MLEGGKFKFVFNEDFVGLVEFEYEFCNKVVENLCNIVFVSIDI